MSHLGRNDPCPCGSGKKYKKCCLGKEASPSASGTPHLAEGPPAPEPSLPPGSAFTLAERASAIGQLMRFAQRPEFEDDWAMGLTIFTGEGLLEPPRQAVADAMRTEMAQVNFHSWFLFDMNLDEGQTLAHLFLQRRGSGLNRGERAYIERALEAHFRLYEILEVRRDEGFTLRDLLTGERLDVREKMATRSFVQWDVAAMRLMDYGGGHVCIDAGIIPFRREDKDPLLKELARLRKRAADLDEATFFKRIVPTLNHWWLERTANPPLPKIVTAEGDSLLFTKVHFDVTDASALRRALNASPDLQPEGEDEWGWIEPLPDGGVRSLGHARLKNDRLTLDVTSQQRGERGRKLLEKLAGRSLKHRATEHQDVEQAFAGQEPGDEGPEPDEPGIPQEEQERIIREYLDAHYHQWPDVPLPALKGKTPRQAAAHARSRPKVIELLKHLEHNEGRGTLHDGPSYDFGWLWKELGLDRDRDA